MSKGEHVSFPFPFLFLLPLQRFKSDTSNRASSTYKSVLIHHLWQLVLQPSLVVSEWREKWMGIWGKGFTNCYCSYLRISREHGFPSMSLPNRFIIWIKSPREPGRNISSKVLIFRTFQSPVFGAASGWVSSVSFWSENIFLILAIHGKTRSWKRGYPLRIKLVKYTVWLWSAICEHKAKDSVWMCHSRICRHPNLQ